jgi:hypothetical protein
MRGGLSESASRLGELVGGEGGGGFSEGDVTRGSFRAEVGFSALFFFYHAWCRVRQIPSTLGRSFARVGIFFTVLCFRASVGALLSNVSALNWQFLPRGRNLTRLLKML